MRFRTSVCTLGIAAVLAACVALGAQADLHQAKIGEALPDFTLTDANGKTHKLSAYKGKPVVINFLSRDCPWSKGAEPSVSALAKEFEGKDVVFIGVNSNDGATAAQMKDYAASAGIPYAIVIDEGNVYADAVGASRTPEIYVVDKSGTLVYHGAYDDRKEPEGKGATNYTKLAIEAVLAGKPVEKAEVNAWGCGIKRVEKATD
jgi:thiol-disulfide isomerase/thioredoxin